MILSVSRRTDIPAFYSEWFLNRVRDGYVCVRNPMNYHQISNVSLDPKVIDCIVFWTKNAEPILKYLPEIKELYPLYFQYTLNAYDTDIERSLPILEKKVATFCKLSDMIGNKAVIWRYDPVLLTEKYNVAWHKAHFEDIAKQLCGKTSRCVFSFIDMYDKIKTNIKGSGVRECTIGEIKELAEAFACTAAKYNIQLQTCAEGVDLNKYGIVHGSCIDRTLIEDLIGCHLIDKVKKDPNQRNECHCLEAVDIGQYNTCKHGCRYCYANFNPQSVVTFSKMHNPQSPLLIGQIESGDKVTEREMKSWKKPKQVAEQLEFSLMI